VAAFALRLRPMWSEQLQLKQQAQVRLRKARTTQIPRHRRSPTRGQTRPHALGPKKPGVGKINSQQRESVQQYRPTRPTRRANCCSVRIPRARDDAQVAVSVPHRPSICLARPQPWALRFSTTVQLLMPAFHSRHRAQCLQCSRPRRKGRPRSRLVRPASRGSREREE